MFAAPDAYALPAIERSSFQPLDCSIAVNSSVNTLHRTATPYQQQILAMVAEAPTDCKYFVSLHHLAICVVRDPLLRTSGVIRNRHPTTVTPTIHLHQIEPDPKPYCHHLFLIYSQCLRGLTG
jgi:hypothetical protein